MLPEIEARRRVFSGAVTTRDFNAIALELGLKWES
jgi:hypothetical protein